MNARCWLCCFFAASTLAAPSPIPAQSLAGWKPPGEIIAVDFRAENPDCRLVFLEDGLAMELPCRFLMVRHPKVRIEAALPEPGEFKFEQVNPAAQVECKVVHAGERQAVAEVIAKLPAMGRDQVNRRVGEIVGEVWGPAEKEARETSEKMSAKALRSYLVEKEIPLPRADNPQDQEKELRKAYVRARTVETIEPEVRDKLNDLAERRPNWVTLQDQAALKKLRRMALLEAWQELVRFEVMEEHVKRCGMEAETNRANFRIRLTARFNALDQALSGKAAGGQGDSIAKGLTPAEQERLRAAVSVDLRCRFYPSVDPKDPNGQWFLGQRVGCKAKGVASIRLEGRLDPANHDRVDWWSLEGFEPVAVQLQYQRNAGFRVDPPFIGDGLARLRIVAGGAQPVAYAVELRPVKPVPDGIRVVVHETSNLLERKFPY